MDSWKHDSRPFIASTYLEKLADENVPKPTATGTPLRYSSFGECARKIAYRIIGAPADDPSPAGLYVMMIGTLLHEKIQEAIGEKFEGAKFEVKSQVGDLISGSADGILTWNGVRYALEIKTMGGVKFKKQIGFKDGRGKGAYIDTPQGPAISAIGQGGWNAVGNGCQEVIVISYALEAISVGKAKEAGLSDSQRVCAEWLVPRDVWVPLVEGETWRQENIFKTVKAGHLPDREALDDSGEIERRDVDRHPLCLNYCEYRDICISDGPGWVENGAK